MPLRKVKKLAKHFTPGLEDFDEEDEEDCYDDQSDSDVSCDVARTSMDVSVAVSSNLSSAGDVQGWRETNGRCIECGQQTHVQLYGEGDYNLPISIPKVVKNGRCLLKERHAKSSSKSRSMMSSLISRRKSNHSDGDSTVQSWEKPESSNVKASKQLIMTFRGHANKVYSVEALGDGFSFVTGSWDKTAIVWDVTTGKERAVFTGHTNGLFSVSPFNFRNGSKDRTFLSGSIDSTVKLWNMRTRQCVKTYEEESSIRCVRSMFASSRDTRHMFITGNLDGVANIWDADSGLRVKSFSGHSDWLSSVDIVAEGKTFITGSADKTVKLWDVGSEKCLQTFSDHAMRVDCTCTLSNECIVSGSSDKTAKIWDVETGKVIRTFKGHTHHINDVARVNPFLFLTASKDKTIKLWDVGTGRCARTYKGHGDMVNSVSSLDDKRLVSVSNDYSAKLWSMV